MEQSKAMRLIEKGILTKGVGVKLYDIANESFIEIEDAYIRKARPCEIEDDWGVVVIKGEEYDCEHIKEIRMVPFEEVISNFIERIKLVNEIQGKETKYHAIFESMFSCIREVEDLTENGMLYYMYD